MRTLNIYPRGDKAFVVIEERENDKPVFKTKRWVENTLEGVTDFCSPYIDRILVEAAYYASLNN